MTDEERRERLDIATKELWDVIKETKPYKITIKIIDWVESKLESISKH